MVNEILDQYEASHLSDLVLDKCKDAGFTASELRDIMYFHFEKMNLTPRELSDYMVIYSNERDGIYGYQLGIKLLKSFEDREDILDRLRAWYRGIIKYFNNQGEWLNYIRENKPSMFLSSILSLDNLETQNYRFTDILYDGSILSLI